MKVVTYTGITIDEFVENKKIPNYLVSQFTNKLRRLALLEKDCIGAFVFICNNCSFMCSQYEMYSFELEHNDIPEMEIYITFVDEKSIILLFDAVFV